MSESAGQKRNRQVGTALMVMGTVLAVAAAVVVHIIELPAVNSFGVELYPQFPSGWIPAIIAKTVSLTGILIAMAGMALAFLYDRELTWARATIGAFLFTSLMLILYAVIPNEYLTLTQGTLDWSAAKEWVPIPSVLTLGNRITVSAEAIKDLIGQGYVLTITVAIVVVMLKWQDRSKRLAEEGPPPLVSKYGRPVTKVER